MKKFILLIFTVYIFINCYSQTNDYSWRYLISNPYAFDSIEQTFEDYVDSNYPDSIPPENLKEIKNYYRFVYFWKDRLGLVNDSVSYLPYTLAAYDNITNPICDGIDSANWQLVGPSKLNGDKQWLGLVDEVLYDPNNPNNYLISADRGGIWKKNGSNWVNKTDNLKLPGLAATEIIRDPDTSDHLFASTAWGILNSGKYGIGLIESWDNGENWSVVDSFPYQTIPYLQRVIYDPNNNEHLYAIGNDLQQKPKLYQSLDGGLSWSEFSPGFPSSITQGHIPQDIEIDVNGHIYVALRYLWDANARILKYNNSQWVDINSASNDIFGGSILNYRITKPDGGLIFVLCDSANIDSVTSGYRKIFKTTDYGSTWTNIKTFDYNVQGLDCYVGEKNEIEYSRESGLVYIGGIKLFILRYNGSSYSHYRISTFDTLRPYHMDIRDFDFMGIDQDHFEHVLAANDGGVSWFKFKRWNPSEYDHTNLNGNHLPIGNFVGFGINNKGDEKIVGGTVHCANFYYKDQTQSWSHISGFDGSDCAINWADPEIAYIMSNQQMWKIDSFPSKTMFYGGGSWFVGMKYKLNPFDPNTIYFGRGQMDYNGTEKATLVKYDGSDAVEIGVLSEMGAVGSIEIGADGKIFVADFGSAEPGENGRFAVSSDGGVNWTDLSQGTIVPSSDVLYNIIGYKTINSIVCHPNDASKLWLGITGIFTDNGVPVDEKYRVLFSSDTGATWIDYSDGLGPFPVETMVYQDGSPERLFIGTDVGVFYRDSTMNQWECFSNNLPVSIITELEYDVCSNQLYASTYGRGIFKTDVPFNDNITTTLPSGIISWDGERRITNDLIIPNGTTLTVSANLYLSEDVKIIVEAGGTLIIEDSKLTNLCNGLWGGIEVWGIPDSSQLYYGVQGTVEIYDATIENAYYGVFTGKKDNSGNYIDGFEGGIIKARNSVFTNIEQPIVIKPYENIFPPTQNEVNNLCRFDNCSFIRTDTSVVVYKHVQLEDVYGVRFRGCLFSDETAFDPILIFKNRGIGISSFASTFYVERYCLTPQQNPCETLKPCEFKQLNYGIWATGVYLDNTCNVEYANLDSNANGIYLSTMEQATIIRNNFNVPSTNDTIELTYYSGLYLDYCRGYTVEENDFISNYYYNPFEKELSVGIAVNYSGPLPNEIYNNKCDSIYVGVLAQNNNRDKDGNAGLQISCNVFNMCEYDIAVTAEQGCSNPGIKEDQGNPGNDEKDPANNIFTNQPYNPESDYFNGCNNIDYYYYGNKNGYALVPTYSTPSPKVDTIQNPTLFFPFNKDDACPSRLESISGGGGGIEEQRNLLVEADFKIDSSTNLLEVLIDDGSTETMTIEVQTSTPDESLVIHNDLMDSSPYLSDSVMVIATEKENVLSSAMLTDILVSNPQAAKSDTVQQALDNRLNQLSDIQRTDIDQGYFIIGAKESLESSLFNYYASRQRAFNNLVRIIRNDTLNFSRQDSIINILSNENNILSKYKLAFEKLSKGTINEALSIINDIPTDFTLSSAQLSNHTQYQLFFSLLASYKSQGKSIIYSDNTAINTLYGILSNSTGSLQAKIRNLLINIDTLTYNEPYILPDMMLKQYKAIRIPKRKEYNENRFKMYPNPAGSYVIIEYSTVYSTVSGRIEFSTIKGDTQKSIPIENQHDYLVLSTYDLKPGTYFVKFVVNNSLVETQKLIVSQ